ncbi:transcription initiation factor TFIID subunit 8-like [Rutidosis leptorrhynchoides]|uniref:transcription initiation factor TFIID subunit 8-like n=1 Tax=Rutidosis leptorrhynchoides TaxID=125765 RepID=UPI003A99E6D1
MSDGESSKEIEFSLKKKRRKNDEFAQAIARIAVAQVCESVGFQGFQQSALDTFSDVACKYICEIGKMSSFNANIAGRTECNVFDIIQGLEDLSISQGFAGASDRDHCLSGSGVIKEISQFVSLSEEIGFAYSVPSFPIVKEHKSTSSFLQAGEKPPTDDIPVWLPKFPDLSTYRIMPSASKEETEVMPDRIEQEQKVNEPSSSKLEQFWSRNESENPVVIEQVDNSGRDRTRNPFLAVPLQPGEKEISLITVPAKFKEEDMVKNHSNHVSELDASAKENQAVNASRRDLEEARQKVVLNDRSMMKVKLQFNRKTLDPANRHNEKGKVESVFWFMNDDVRDEKEKITEELLTEPMEVEEQKGDDLVVN